MKEPKTIEEALRQIRAAEKAKTLFTEQGYQYNIHLPALPVAFVLSPDDKGYHLTIEDGTVTHCTCPAFAETKDYCKHQIALQEVLNERAALEAQCAAYEEAYANDEGAFSTNGGGVLW
jgi:hypothetical protein